MTEEMNPRYPTSSRRANARWAAKALAVTATAGLILGLSVGLGSSAVGEESGAEPFSTADAIEPSHSSGVGSEPSGDASPAPTPIEPSNPEPTEAAVPTPSAEPIASPTPSATSVPKSGERSATAQASTGAIKGTVRGEDGAVLRNALITVFADPIKRVRTDADGKYSVSGLKKSTYKVTVNAHKRSSGWLSQDVVVAVKPGVSLTQNFVLVQGAGVTGTITNIHGVPIPFAEVKTRGGTPNGTTVADAHGKYAMNGFQKKKSMNVLAVADGYLQAQKSVDLTVATTATVDLTLPRPGKVAGTVTDKVTGKPIKGILVSAFEDEDVTDSQGRYSMNAVEVGANRVSAKVDTSSKARPLPSYLDGYVVFTGKSGVQSTVDIKLAPGAVIRGTLKDTKGRLYTTGEYYVSVTKTVYDEYDDNEITVARTRVEPDGSYRLVGVPTGSYAVRVTVCARGSDGETQCEDPDGYDPADYVSIRAPHVKRMNLRYDALFFNVWSVEVSGKYAVGHTLRAEVKKPMPKPSSWSYRWYRNGIAIGGATKRSYTLKPQDTGKWITVQYSANRLHFATLNEMSYREKVAG